MADLQPHEQRVIAELDELRGRLAKLDTFMGSRTFVNMGAEDRELLVLQNHLMSSLGFVLARRIARFRTDGVAETPAVDHRAVMQRALAALEMAHAGLEWYRDGQPENVNGSDEEADEAMGDAMQALRDALADGVDASAGGQEG